MSVPPLLSLMISFHSEFFFSPSERKINCLEEKPFFFPSSEIWLMCLGIEIKLIEIVLKKVNNFR